MANPVLIPIVLAGIAASLSLAIVVYCAYFKRILHQNDGEAPPARFHQISLRWLIGVITAHAALYAIFFVPGSPLINRVRICVPVLLGAVLLTVALFARRPHADRAFAIAAALPQLAFTAQFVWNWYDFSNLPPSAMTRGWEYQVEIGSIVAFIVFLAGPICGLAAVVGLRILRWALRLAKGYATSHDLRRAASR